MSRFQKFDNIYQEAIKTIEHFLDTKDPAGIDVLAKWMLETDANPYAYLPDTWAGSVGSAENFASLLHYIHHAVHDDGEITFVTVNDEPRIIFVYPEDDEMLKKHALSDTERNIAARGSNFKYDIKVLDITPGEFGALYDEYQRLDLMRCFSMDAGRMGIATATEWYKKYKCFSEDWIAVCSAEIAKWKNFYDRGSRK